MKSINAAVAAILALFASKPVAPVNTDSIVSALADTIAKLDAHSQASDDLALDLHEQAAALKHQAHQAEKEAERASRIASKLDDLLG